MRWLGGERIEITAVDDLDGCHAVNELLAGVWEMPPGTHFVPSPLLLVMVHAGNYVVAATENRRMIGASMAFLGLEGTHSILHSHVTGVVPDAQGRAVGFALKQHQRDWCLARGIETVEWTFDPLVRRNGYFNLEKLGATVTDYYTNYYGRMRDGINQGDDTDRCLVRWSLRDSGAGRPPEPGRNPSNATNVILVPVPDDIVALRQSDPDAAAEWRVRVRDSMGAAIAAGYRATGMTEDGAYILTKPEDGS